MAQAPTRRSTQKGARPGETILVLAAIYAATEPSFNVWVLVAVAAFGAITGDKIGYWLGKRYGYALLLRYGERIGMFEARIKLGQYLFLKYGARVVFLGRFVALLRILAAFLAGLNRMPWPAFLIANASSGVIWAAVLPTPWTRGSQPSAIFVATGRPKQIGGLFTTLVRFDVVYVGHFKCNLRRIVDYANLWGFTRELYQYPGVADTTNFSHIKQHYYQSHHKINPTGIVPLGPDLNFLSPHGRERLPAKYAA